jgi:RHS repeat-associated protein
MTRRIDENNKDWTYTWTVDNRLARATTAGGDDARFVYDADGAMVLRNDNGQRTVFLGNLYQRNLVTGVQTKHYLFGGKLVAMRQDSNAANFLLTDHLGSVNVTLNSDGTIHSRLRYDHWGKQRWAQNNTPTDYRYTAQRFDAKLGIYDYRARYYDPYINQHPHHHQAQGGQSFCWYGKFCRTRCYLVQANQRFALHSLSTRFLRSFRPNLIPNQPDFMLHYPYERNG